MKDVTPLLTHWSYVFLALTPRYMHEYYTLPAINMHEQTNHAGQMIAMISNLQFIHPDGINIKTHLLIAISGSTNELH